MIEDVKLPAAATSTEQILIAIVLELRKLNAAIAQLSQPVTIAGEPIELRGVEPKPKRSK